MIKRLLTTLVVSLMGAATLVGIGVSPAEATCAPLCYYYVDGSEAHTAGGVLASMDVLKPTINTAKGDIHSLIEMSVEDSSGNRIELGWTVDPGLNGDNNPHLFTFYSKGGVLSGYNVGVTNCGGAVTSPTATPGGTLTYPQFPAWGIVHDGAYWWLKFGTGWVGCLPDTIWTSVGQTFTQGTFFQLFGEVASSHDYGTGAGAPPCAFMGSGTKGSLKATVTPNAARIGNTTYYNDTYVPNLYQRSTPAAISSIYDVGIVNTRSMYIGGKVALPNASC
jgi:hypothetical protein